MGVLPEGAIFTVGAALLPGGLHCNKGVGGGKRKEESSFLKKRSKKLLLIKEWMVNWRRAR
jgi:hypothetical protein